jgi:hypothetical protein
MPIRTASFRKRISDNGRALHRARLRRESGGVDQDPPKDELALMEQRLQLKEQRGERQTQAKQPRPTAAERMVRTHRAQARDKPKAGEAGHGSKEAKEAGKPKARRSRAEKHAEKAAAVEAARRSPKKPAK